MKMKKTKTMPEMAAACGRYLHCQRILLHQLRRVIVVHPLSPTEKPITWRLGAKKSPAKQMDFRCCFTWMVAFLIVAGGSSFALSSNVLVQSFRMLIKRNLMVAKR